MPDSHAWISDLGDNNCIAHWHSYTQRNLIAENQTPNPNLNTLQYAHKYDLWCGQ